MALKHVNAVIVGAGGGVVAKELSTAGLSVVLLERGKWYSAADCRKDDLHNQRTTVLGNAFGPDDERNPRVLVDKRGERIVLPSEGEYSNNAASVGGGTFSYGAQAWRYMEKDFRMRSAYGAVAGSTLDDWPISYSEMEPFYKRRPNGKWASPATIQITSSKLRGAGRCPCRRWRRARNISSCKQRPSA
jgi:choline dehydrogenase-like flavoprotein